MDVLQVRGVFQFFQEKVLKLLSKGHANDVIILKKLATILTLENVFVKISNMCFRR